MKNNYQVKTHNLNLNVNGNINNYSGSMDDLKNYTSNYINQILITMFA
jgi:hypothetical protein